MLCEQRRDAGRFERIDRDHAHRVQEAAVRLRVVDGTVFDDSKQHGHPFTFAVGGGMVIQGWDKGLAGMRVGGVRRLTIPPEEAYGERGHPPAIPPNATLSFEIELLSIP